ncbi:MAG: hypothetical protein WBM32_00220 [Crocosphaera sp.]
MQSTYPDYRLELVDGEIKPRKLGRVTASSAGFNLPDANTRSLRCFFCFGLILI